MNALGLRDLSTGDETTRLEALPPLLAGLQPAIEAFRTTLADSRPLGFVGCGSSLDVPEALGRVAASGAASAVSASESIDDAATWIAVTRSGRTAELLDLMDAHPITHAITCDPASPVADRVEHVLDLSAAADSGFVAAASTVATAAAITQLLGASHDEIRAALAPSDARGEDPLPSGAPVAWLGPWVAAPLGRELTRKAIETGRPSTFAHLFEFLHGDDQMFRGDAVWIAIDRPDRLRRLRGAVSELDAARLLTVPFEWDAASPAKLTALLARLYRLLFQAEERR